MEKTLLNPYTARGVIKDRDGVYGRHEMLQKIKAVLAKKQCCALVGERKIGKSSILYHLWDTLNEDEAFKDFILVYLDMSDASISGGPESFFKIVRQEVNRKLRNAKRPEIPERAIPEPYEDFRNFLADLNEQNLTLTLLLDEFDYLAGNAKFDIEFRQFLRAQMRYDFAYVTATFKEFEFLFLEDLKADLASPWYNTFVVYRVGAFSGDEAKEFIRKSSEKSGLPLQNYENEIIAMAGTHPLLLQIVCGLYFEHLIKTERGDGTEKLKEQIARDFDLRFQLQLIWECLDDYEKKAVFRIAHKEAVREVRVLNRLEEKAYVNDGQLFSGLFQKYVLEQHPRDFQMHKPLEAKEFVELSVNCNIERKFMNVTLTADRDPIQSDDSPELLQIDIDRYAEKAKRAAVHDDWRFDVKDIGGTDGLFNEIFQRHPVLWNMYSRGLGLVNGKDHQLAFVFKSAQRDFLRVPLEFLFDRQEYLALKHPISRHLNGFTAHRNSLTEFIVKRQDKLRILLIASNTMPPIPGVDQEITELDQTLRQLLRSRGLDFEIVCLTSSKATYDRVRAELHNCSYHIVHYAGHGDQREKLAEDSGIFLWEDEEKQGAVKMITAGGLATLVRGSELRFVFLSCCLGSAVSEERQLLHGDFLGIAESLIVAGVPSVLGYRWAVSDDGARKMASAFYESFFRGNNLSEALLDARRAIASEGRGDRTWASPILINQRT